MEANVIRILFTAFLLISAAWNSVHAESFRISGAYLEFMRIEKHFRYSSDENLYGAMGSLGVRTQWKSGSSLTWLLTRAVSEVDYLENDMDENLSYKEDEGIGGGFLISENVSDNFTLHLLALVPNMDYIRFLVRFGIGYRIAANETGSTELMFHFPPFGSINDGKRGSWGFFDHTRFIGLGLAVNW